MLSQRTRQTKVQQPAMDAYLKGGTPIQVTTITSTGSGTAATVLLGNTMPRVSSSMVTGIILKAIGYSSKPH